MILKIKEMLFSEMKYGNNRYKNVKNKSHMFRYIMEVRDEIMIVEAITSSKNL